MSGASVARCPYLIISAARAPAHCPPCCPSPALLPVACSAALACRLTAVWCPPPVSCPLSPARCAARFARRCPRCSPPVMALLPVELYRCRCCSCPLWRSVAALAALATTDLHKTWAPWRRAARRCPRLSVRHFRAIRPCSWQRTVCVIRSTGSATGLTGGAEGEGWQVAVLIRARVGRLPRPGRTPVQAGKDGGAGRWLGRRWRADRVGQDRVRQAAERAAAQGAVRPASGGGVEMAQWEGWGGWSVSAPDDVPGRQDGRCRLRLPLRRLVRRFEG